MFLHQLHGGRVDSSFLPHILAKDKASVIYVKFMIEGPAYSLDHIDSPGIHRVRLMIDRL